MEATPDIAPGHVSGADRGPGPFDPRVPHSVLGTLRNVAVDGSFEPGIVHQVKLGVTAHVLNLEVVQLFHFFCDSVDQPSDLPDPIGGDVNDKNPGGRLCDENPERSLCEDKASYMH